MSVPKKHSPRCHGADKPKRKKDYGKPLVGKPNHTFADRLVGRPINGIGESLKELERELKK